MNLEEFASFYERITEEEGYMLHIKNYTPAYIAHRGIKPLLDLARVFRNMMDLWYQTGQIREEDMRQADQILAEMDNNKFIDERFMDE